MNAPLFRLILDLADRDAQRGEPGRLLPPLLTFVTPQHPEREIRETYHARYQTAALALATMRAGGAIRRGGVR